MKDGLEPCPPGLPHSLVAPTISSLTYFLVRLLPLVATVAIAEAALSENDVILPFVDTSVALRVSTVMDGHLPPHFLPTLGEASAH